MNLQLDGKRVLVSGSTAAIGFAIAVAMAHEGARVIVNGAHTSGGINPCVRQKGAEHGSSGR